ncbi:PIN domain-containing protein, partial [Nostoc parmelioides]
TYPLYHLLRQNLAVRYACLYPLLSILVLYLDAFALLLGSITILPFGLEEAEQTARVRGILKTAGNPIGAYDVLIAATALTHDHILVTSNVREFQRVPNLQIENWRSS